MWYFLHFQNSSSDNGISILNPKIYRLYVFLVRIYGLRQPVCVIVQLTPQVHVPLDGNLVAIGLVLDRVQIVGHKSHDEKLRVVYRARGFPPRKEAEARPPCALRLRSVGHHHLSPS